MKKSAPKYKVGIIGCGGIFPRHLEAIRTNSDYYELVSICDIDPKKVNIHSQELNVPGFTSHNEMLDKMKNKMNFVVIATPNSYHFEQAIDALNAKKDILIEKPIDFKASRIKDISLAAKKNKRKAYSVLQVRYNNTINMLREALDKEYLGKLRSVSLIQRWQRPEQYFASWRADIKIGGRTLYEVGIHYMDIMQLLFGKPRVLGSSTFSNKHKNIAFEDTVFALLDFPKGFSGSLEVTIASEPHNLECSLAVMGSDGFIKIGGRALDSVEQALFNNNLRESEWNKLVESYGEALAPNSYGLYAGSCPNHPTLYKQIALGKGLDITESVPVVEFIEDVYKKEIKNA